MYKAFKLFISLGLIFIVVGALVMVRFIYFYIQGNGAGHIQSLIFSSVVVTTGINTIILGVVADLIAVNRKLIEQ